MACESAGDGTKANVSKTKPKHSLPQNLKSYWKSSTKGTGLLSHCQLNQQSRLRAPQTAIIRSCLQLL
ncbi:hypothetical protein EVAR_89331_1 [Eumeta japonica]|uniref:Uncharacterized protein n=1 Tax=Eumeta variegata TaxID=151549 RepID=A0A4C1Y1T0_EUMVA|nr:hypothetical protein EVAR_89331_1 [Eumeta japonica]